ncbi:hypothetical protein PsAD46_04348 [Pseudovibrio sp. Ad46]|nr:hypothetical protein PsAD46_04348 [Pseudovibrio sp. Ad46]
MGRAISAIIIGKVHHVIAGELRSHVLIKPFAGNSIEQGCNSWISGVIVIQTSTLINLNEPVQLKRRDRRHVIINNHGKAGVGCITITVSCDKAEGQFNIIFGTSNKMIQIVQQLKAIRTRPII